MHPMWRLHWSYRSPLCARPAPRGHLLSDNVWSRAKQKADLHRNHSKTNICPIRKRYFFLQLLIVLAILLLIFLEDIYLLEESADVKKKQRRSVLGLVNTHRSVSTSLNKQLIFKFVRNILTVFL